MAKAVLVLRWMLRERQQAWGPELERGTSYNREIERAFARAVTQLDDPGRRLATADIDDLTALEREKDQIDGPPCN